MRYHALANDTGGTADDRRSEADRILNMIVGHLTPEELTGKEADFVASIMDGNVPVSPKQLFWLRDIKDKYL